MDNTPELRQEILARIGDQVKALLMQAKKDSENKVKAELKVIHDAMREMDARLDALGKQLDDVDVQPSQGVEQSAVAQALAKVEQQWGSELGKLKQELHQTIFAHNHNADLMKHQKDALEQISTELGKQKTPDAERLKQAKEQLAKVEAALKGQAKQQRMEPVFERLAAIENRLTLALRSSWPAAMGRGLPMAGLHAQAAALAGMQHAGLGALAGGRGGMPARK